MSIPFLSTLGPLNTVLGPPRPWGHVPARIGLGSMYYVPGALCFLYPSLLMDPLIIPDFAAILISSTFSPAAVLGGKTLEYKADGLKLASQSATWQDKFFRD